MAKLLHERAVALGQSIDASTRITYSSQVQSYLSFCKAHDLPVEPTPDTLSFFTVYMSHHIKPSSVASYLSGICNQLEPFFPDVRMARRSPLVTRTLAGCKRLFNSPTNRKRALSLDDIVSLLAAHPPSSHDNLLFRSITLNAFFALHRLGELTWSDDPRRRSSRKLVRRSSVAVEHDHFSYVLPGHKADRFFEGSTIMISRRALSDPADPMEPFMDYLRSRDNLFPFHSELFLTSDGTPPTRSWYLDGLRAVFPDASVGGHSLRAGGATFFAGEGWPDDRIQALGRWSSDAFKMYIRKNPVILQALLHSRGPDSVTVSRS